MCYHLFRTHDNKLWLSVLTVRMENRHHCLVLVIAKLHIIWFEAMICSVHFTKYCNVDVPINQFWLRHALTIDSYVKLHCSPLQRESLNTATLQTNLCLLS